MPGAFKSSIQRWQASGKQIPLHYDHSAAAEDIIGTVDPASMRETEAGLLVSGRLDLKGSGTAREAWRSIKANALALSFGYMTLSENKRADGINELLELDLFEVSVVPAPANPDTKFLNFKSAEATLAEATEEEAAVEDGGDEEPETVKSAPQDPLVQEAWDLILRPNTAKRLPEPPEPEPEPEPLDAAQVQREAWELVLKTSG